jgi:hypothetical protein
MVLKIRETPESIFIGPSISTLDSLALKKENPKYLE